MPRATLNNSRGTTTKSKGFVAHSPKHDSRIETDPNNPDYKVVEVIRSNEGSFMRQKLANGNINDYFGIRPEGREGMFPDNMGDDYFEHELYEQKFKKFRDELNKGRKKNRNKEIDADQMRSSRNYCPEQVIFQVGKYNGVIGQYEGVSSELLMKINDDFLEWRKSEFPQVMCVGRSTHLDEASTHIQMHDIYTYNAVDENGEEYLAIGQGKCLDQMGVELPPPEYLEALKADGKCKTESSIKRYYNKKTTYTAKCREKMKEICKEYGVELIEDKVKHPGQSLVAYKAEQIRLTREHLAEKEAQLNAREVQLEAEKKTYKEQLKAESDKIVAEAKDMRDYYIERAEDLNEIYLQVYDKLTEKQAKEVPKQEAVIRAEVKAKEKGLSPETKELLIKQAEAETEGVQKTAGDNARDITL